MANEGLGRLSTILNITLTGSAQTSTVLHSYGAEYLALYTSHVHTTANITTFKVEVSDDGGTTYREIPLHTRSTLTTSDNWRNVVRCGRFDRLFRVSVTGSGTDTAGTVVTKAQFNRVNKPALVS